MFIGARRVLPNADAIFWSEIELVGEFDVEGGVPAVFVADGEGAILSGRVRVGEDLLAESSVAGEVPTRVWGT